MADSRDTRSMTHRPMSACSACYREVRHSGNSGKVVRVEAFALLRRRSFMAAVTATRFDERRTTTFGAVGVAGVFVFMASLKNSLSCMQPGTFRPPRLLTA